MSSPIFDARRRAVLRASAWVPLSVALAASASQAASAQVLEPAMSGAGSQGQGVASGHASGLLPYRIAHPNAFFHDRVLELFEFTCPYCRQVNDGAVEWGKTLPKPFVFEQIPIVYNDTTAKAAGFVYLVAKSFPKLMPNFMDAMFSLVQDQSQPLSANATYVRAMAQAGMTEAQFRQAVSQDQGLQAYIQRAARLSKLVRPRVTPTFVVNDYVTDVSYTGGDYQKLFKLLDGLVSQQIQRG